MVFSQGTFEGFGTRQSSVKLLQGGFAMPGHTYHVIELVGSSHTSLTDAIESAVKRASALHEGLGWFEVGQARGQIHEGRVLWYQVDVRIGHRLKADDSVDDGAPSREDPGSDGLGRY